ncbi:hypothetical protein Cabys_2791 [Caldithrix abyssi DSM 13497]|uniref:Uncharacterized protein n=1 Tax=Caldithrix abyssi DSM 13497 TaxID=880073 RepID=A0A1J1CA15_CALAY|nr:hypothetical protein Cabys_2791 [Caldithrix abyssi DSM 13497]
MHLCFLKFPFSFAQVTHYPLPVTLYELTQPVKRKISFQDNIRGQ